MRIKQQEELPSKPSSIPLPGSSQGCPAIHLHRSLSAGARPSLWFLNNSGNVTTRRPVSGLSTIKKKHLPCRKRSKELPDAGLRAFVRPGGCCRWLYQRCGQLRHAGQDLPAQQCLSKGSLSLTCGRMHSHSQWQLPVMLTKMHLSCTRTKSSR